MSRREVPVQLGEKVTLTITGLAHNGAGVGKYEGFTIFVPGTIPDETVTVEVDQVKKQYATAKLQSLDLEHPQRVVAPCPVFDACGGCQTQHLSYPLQLEMKRRQVRDQFERIGGFADLQVETTIGMDEGAQWRYRNKSQIPFAFQQGKAVSGFFAPNSHDIVEFPECIIQHQMADEVIGRIRELVRKWKIPAYDEKRHQGVLRHVMIRVGFETNQVMVVLVTRTSELPHQAEWIEELRKFPEIRSIYQNINSERTNVVLGKQNRLLWGEPTITDQVGKVSFSISPHSFFQINPIQTKVLYDVVKEYADLSGKETVLDLYCGTGSIGLYLADQAKQVIGIEVVADAIEDAKKNATNNGITHASYLVGKAEKVMPRLVRDGISADVVIVDPPRKGCHEELLEAVAEVQPKKLVYVSCNPATLARDAKWLAEHGFELTKVQPVDMFPQTSHVETVALFVRVD
ncbi:23S rRNA (uracil(1939)-C(5))-methyltransferase RlmD [Risungbinella massiliensis]|uniref:23S rRNA (uracil(1939)-C(5))-methyltransferase RlmD n=1 Tax=Risungbinella massiliensis TaxID=1329796 RepID=UPI0005CC2663|nr:23S rRNA (uracil(1939)-C(5))-methyltransferase RlmD [Risungbinella massiliensis]